MPDNPAVDIVICVHNALDEVRACIDSVIRARSDHFVERLILVDDGSAAETAQYLAELGSIPGVELLRSDEATGYTKAANRGLRYSTAETIVLLNSDTVVPLGWIAKLRSTLSYSPDIGLVGPLSNAATYQSVPRVVDEAGKFAVNILPADTSVDDYDRWLQERSQDVEIRPRVQLLNGFCIMLKRSVIEKIGYLDEASFPRGYGEENDYCFRAGDAGFGLLVSIDTFVFHSKSASYGSTMRDKLAAEGRNAFRSKYSAHRIDGATESMRTNPILSEIRNRMQDPVTSSAEKAVSHPSDEESLAWYLSTNTYDHIDFGCSKGGSLEFARRKLGGARGLGIDLSKSKVDQTRAAGFDACIADATSLSLHPGAVRFVTMLDFLEHLPSVSNARGCISAACAVASEFVYIRQPWFDSDGYLFSQQLKLYWSDWTGHPNAMTSLEFHNIISNIPGVQRWRLFGVKRIDDSNHPAVHSLLSPKDQSVWEASKHPPKPSVKFSQPIFTQIACVVELTQHGLPSIVEEGLSGYELIFDARAALQAAA
ncbi:N-acetylglucosaminyl-diphospho-decaprenol L-rhamnosyltransferase [Aminobacter sp. MSH1]|uniref:glycosyltransferase n=1 Tax=Aminobacter sp. MSH1 TaxID=374606 RepID=UPI000D3B06BD|nr:glycosyltransferase [Aminobacter sp. MSH1]AWC20843.1 N-acetylglucosaminyl-diphospho-decaprenol L-rhamnosyltransferase [Aminobacter sp. MSH1]